ncbi:PQ loop repeat-domain-containing protein [Xylogone sp. PMI_703]|nr:PQ loop repeat-domain-containing protein [Xylogone sp. PMI_703]
MFPPSQSLDLDISAISGICGSISIACWVVVFSPQIVENFKRGSADGLSLQFIIVWLAGDVFNILGAVLQGVLPTMIILAVYYTLADIVLLGQCFYYKGFTWKDEVPEAIKPAAAVGEPNERTGLLPPSSRIEDNERRSSIWSNTDVSHLNPVTPLLDARDIESAALNPSQTTSSQVLLFNLTAILMVCAAGVFGWYVGNNSQAGPRNPDGGSEDPLQFNLWGQIFGYFCALLYLGSRIPQILLNYRRKSTDGVSMLFFIFACLGNLTYVLSIFAYDPTSQCTGKHNTCGAGEAARIYGHYILINASWLAGSLGTLFLDMGIFCQFFMYRDQSTVTQLLPEPLPETDIPAPQANKKRRLSTDDRPLLERGDTEYA